MAEPYRRSPLISAGILLGAGLGGFVDGIGFHQILQFHNMLSAQISPNTLVNAKINMFWDGLFHAGVWGLTVLGLARLWYAGRRRDVPWSGKLLVGSLLAGWGLFNLVEGLIDHHLLGIHHVSEYSSRRPLWDLAFLASGAALLLAGWAFLPAGRRDRMARGEASPAPE